MQSFVERCWFGKNFWTYVLLPLSVLYWLITNIRRLCYCLKIFKVYHSRVPVIVVGNIMTGGNGKTPVVIALADFLSKRGMRVAVVSRGYRAKPPVYPYEVSGNSPIDESGDEPKLIALRAGVRVVIAPIRVRAIKHVENDVDVILPVDGLQHYAMGTDIEIVVSDGLRRQGNGYLLPAGPLREGVSRLQQVDFRIVNGGESKIGEYAMQLRANKPYALDKKSQLNDGSEVCCLAGIGDPNRFYRTFYSNDSTTTEIYTLSLHLSFTNLQI